MNAKITSDNNARKPRTVFRYLLACDLSLATSLISSVPYPKPENTAKIATNARTNEYLPKTTAPKLRAMKIDNTSDKSGNNNLICEQCRRILCFKIRWTDFRVSIRKARKNG